MTEEATEWHTGNPDDPCPYCRPHEAVDQRSPQEQSDMIITHDEILAIKPDGKIEDLPGTPAMAFETMRVLYERLDKIKQLFASGPDTRCRTRWRCDHRGWLDICPDDSTHVECFEVPIEDVREALNE